jgi:hypothetical protein
MRQCAKLLTAATCSEIPSDVSVYGDGRKVESGNRAAYILNKIQDDKAASATAERFDRSVNAENSGPR